MPVLHSGLGWLHADNPLPPPLPGPRPQMLKPFKPAEDRFDGVEVQRSEATGAVIIPEAAAYLECKVEDRMDAGIRVLL